MLSLIQPFSQASARQSQRTPSSLGDRLYKGLKGAIVLGSNLIAQLLPQQSSSVLLLFIKTISIYLDSSSRRIVGSYTILSTYPTKPTIIIQTSTTFLSVVIKSSIVSRRSALLLTSYYQVFILQLIYMQYYQRPSVPSKIG